MRIAFLGKETVAVSSIMHQEEERDRSRPHTTCTATVMRIQLQLLEEWQNVPQFEAKYNF
jgi:hypothetical protein